MDVIIREGLYGWEIFCPDTGRAYSTLTSNNDLKPITFPTKDLAKAEAIRLDYKIIGFERWS